MIYKKGFTLVELMVTVAIAGIVTTVGVPSFFQTIRNSRLTTNANELIAVINFARSEAVKRGSQVTIRRKGSTSKQWEQGWDVFLDLDANETFDDNGDSSLCEATGDCLLKTYSNIPNNFTLRTGNSSYKDYIAYKSTGLSTSSDGETFRLCDSTADTSVSRTISINAIGRPRVTKGTTSCP